MPDTFEVGKFLGLAKIHGFLFREIYDFARKIRDVEIKVLFKNTVKDKINDREVYF